MTTSETILITGASGQLGHLVLAALQRRAPGAHLVGLVRELCKQVKALGVRVGLEHAGERLTRIEFLFEAGLDYVKLDASVVHGVASDSARRAFVAGSVTMLHSLGLAVYAEGVHDLEDLQALWPCGLNGVTGPAVRFNAP